LNRKFKPYISFFINSIAMKLKNYLFGLCLTGMLFALSSCNKTPKSVSMIDDESFMVLRFDVKQLAEKSGVSDDKDFKEKMDKMLKESGLSKKAADAVKDIMEDPVKMGVDLRDPVFVSMKVVTEKNEWGEYQGVEPEIIGTIFDAGDFAEFVNIISKENGGDEVVEKDGIRCLASHGTALIFDDDSFILTGVDSEDDAEAVIKDFKGRFEGKDGGKMAENENFLAMCERPGAAQFLLFGDKFYKNIDASQKEVLKDLKGMDLLFDLEMNKGEAVVTGEPLFTTEEAKKKHDKSLEMIGDISGDYAPYLSKEFFGIFANIDGAKFYEALEEVPDFKEMKSEIPFDLKKVLGSIKGDVALGANQLDIADNQFGGALYISTPSNDFFDTVTGMLKEQGAPMTEAGTNCYSLNLGYEGPSVQFGLDKKSTFVALSSSTPEPFKNDKNAFSKSDIKGRGFYAFFNFKTLKKLPLSGEEEMVAKEVVKLFDYAECYYDKDNKGVLRVVSNDKDKNILELIVDLIKEYA